MITGAIEIVNYAVVTFTVALNTCNVSTFTGEHLD